VLSLDGPPTQKNISQVVGQSVEPILARLKTSRRDSELCRQILLTLRYLLPSDPPRRRPSRLSGRPFYQDSVWLAAIVARAEGWTLPEDLAATASPVAESASDEELPPELMVDVDSSSGRGRRDRGGRPGRRDRQDERPNGQSDRTTAPVAIAASPTPARPLREDRTSPWLPGPAIRTPIPDLADLGPLPPPRPAFLGNGGFGSSWAARGD
jgi:hypothetical protein